MKNNSSLKLNFLESNLKKLENLHASFDYLKIAIASPERIKTWAERLLPDGESCGEVTRPDTINFRTQKPENSGLFCQIIFGPVNNWKCACGKYSHFFFENINKICEKCHVEITESRVRRYRMGYIELMTPVVHYWYLKGIPNYLLTLLRVYSENLKLSDIEQIVYFKEGFRIITNENPLFPFFIKKTATENSFLENVILNKIKNNSKINFENDSDTETEVINSLNLDINELNFPTALKGNRIGAEILKAALESLSVPLEIRKARAFLHLCSLGDLRKTNTPDKTLVRRIRILENFFATKTNPSWIILTNLPVLPPSLRPFLELENGKLAIADVNEIYKLIITRNQRLFEFLYTYDLPEFLSIYGRKLIQDAVDALIDNTRLPQNKKVLVNNKPLKSLSEILEGKFGRFRHSLLGKRVDFSGRSIIIVNPTLRLNQCGIPYEMACQLFQPFIMNELMKQKEFLFNKKIVNIIINKRKPFIWAIVEQLTKKYNILLNRAPTLHRFGIQAFDPLLILEQAIQLHPLVCTGFNADFDGDQMAVHLPLSSASQLEAKSMMKPSYNILSPANGAAVLKPTQDIVIGCYYLTFMLNKNLNQLKKWFSNEQDALFASYQKKVMLHEPILIRYKISEFNIIQENTDIFIVMKDSYDIEPKKIIVYKRLKKSNEFYYLLCNLGILIIKFSESNKYEITDIFIETTIGRLTFSTNIKKIFEETSKYAN